MICIAQQHASDTCVLSTLRRMCKKFNAPSFLLQFVSEVKSCKVLFLVNTHLLPETLLTASIPSARILQVL